MRSRLRTLAATAAAAIGAPPAVPFRDTTTRADVLHDRRDTLAEVAAYGPAGAFERRTDAGTVAARWDSSIVNEITGLGGPEDKGAAARPQARIPLSDAELAALYLDNGIARRIVDVVPAEATRKGWTVTAAADEVGGKRPQVDAAADEDRRLGVVPKLTEAWSLARLWGHSLVLIVTDDEIPSIFRDNPEAWLTQPLDPTRVRRVVALQVFDALEAWPIEYDADVRSPSFRDPLIWGLSPSIPGVTRGTAGRTPTAVHASRVLYFRGRRRPPSLRHSTGHLLTGARSLDDSELRAVWDEVRNLAQTMAGGATLAQELRESVLKVSGLRALATSDQAAEVQARMRLMARAKSLLGMIVLGEHDEYSNNANPPTGFRELSTEAQAMLSAVTGIPLTILFGHAPAGLSTDDKSGRQSWDRVIRAQQENKLAPHLVKLYGITFAAKQGPTRGEVPIDVRPKFRALLEESDGEIAKTRESIAKADAIYLDRGVVSPEQVAGRFSASGFQLDLAPDDPPEPVDEPTPDERDEVAALAAEAAAPAETEGDETAIVETSAGDMPAGKFADVALNGAQIAQAVQIAVAVQAGDLERDQAIAMLVHLFNLPADAAREIVPEPPEPPETDEVEAPAPPPPFGAPPVDEVEGEGDDLDQGDDDEGEDRGDRGNLTDQTGIVTSAEFIAGRVGLVGPAGVDEHTHSIPPGSALTAPGGLDGHVHAVDLGADVTGPGGADGHTHPIVIPAPAEGVAMRGDAESFRPPTTVAKAARRGLALRESVAPSRRGGTSVGVARARDLANRRPISLDTIGRMVSFFARHEVDKQGKGWKQGEEGYPSKGLQAWLLWGGDPGRAWAGRIWRRERGDEGTP